MVVAGSVPNLKSIINKLFEMVVAGSGPNFKSIINSLGLDAGPVAARKADVKSILVCTPSLGGQNAAIVLRRLA